MIVFFAANVTKKKSESNLKLSNVILNITAKGFFVYFYFIFAYILIKWSFFYVTYVDLLKTSRNQKKNKFKYLNFK